MKYFGVYLQDLEKAEHPVMQHLTDSQIQALELTEAWSNVSEGLHNHNLLSRPLPGGG